MDEFVDDPDGVFDFACLFHAEGELADGVAGNFHHAFEFLHTLTLVDGFWIFLTVAAKVDCGAQLVHGSEVLFPVLIDLVDQKVSLHAMHFGADLVVVRLDNQVAREFRG